jgi:phenylpropionate dioxygenase-like ring-hydroxylating dioxygenase large terminal subunit
MKVKTDDRCGGCQDSLSLHLGVSALSAGTIDLVQQLEQGLTPPAHWYTSAEIANVEREQVFSRSWHYAGSGSQVQNPGDFATSQAAHVPVVVVRGEDRELRAFVNVCRHRRAEVARGSGNRKTLQCPYHAWTYGLDGSLKVAPRSELEPSFPRESLSLVPMRVEEWGPLVFVNLDPHAPALIESLGGAVNFLSEAGLDLAELEFDGREEWLIDANWKVSLEGFLECYHCPIAHPSAVQLLDMDPEHFTYVIGRWTACMAQPLRSDTGNDSGTLYANQTDGELKDALSVLVWPNSTIAVYPGRSNMYVDAWIPVGVERTRRIRDRFFAPDVPRDVRDQMIAVERQVAEEDGVLVESVQRGLQSGIVLQGQLLPACEQLVHRFQALVVENVVEHTAE